MLFRCAALFAASLFASDTALADRFYFGSAETAEKMAAGDSDFVEGVLLRKENGFLVIRVQGGEITVPESAVYKTEATDVTVEQIAQREQEDRERLVEANRRREEARLAREEAERERREAAAKRDAETVECDAAKPCGAVQVPPYSGFTGYGQPSTPYYHPVLDVLVDHGYRAWTPVTPERIDRGRSRYIAAEAYRNLTGH